MHRTSRRDEAGTERRENSVESPRSRYATTFFYSIILPKKNPQILSKKRVSVFLYRQVLIRDPAFSYRVDLIVPDIF